MEIKSLLKDERTLEELEDILKGPGTKGRKTPRIIPHFVRTYWPSGEPMGLGLEFGSKNEENETEKNVPERNKWSRE